MAINEIMQEKPWFGCSTTVNVRKDNKRMWNSDCFNKKFYFLLIGSNSLSVKNWNILKSHTTKVKCKNCKKNLSKKILPWGNKILEFQFLIVYNKFNHYLLLISHSHIPKVFSYHSFINLAFFLFSCSLNFKHMMN